MKWGCYEGQDVNPCENAGGGAFLVTIRTGFKEAQQWYAYSHGFVVTANDKEDAQQRLLLDMKATIEHVRESSPPEAFEHHLSSMGSEFGSATSNLLEWIDVIESQDYRKGTVSMERLNGCYSVGYFGDHRGVLNHYIKNTIQEMENAHGV